MQQAGNPIMQ